MKAGTYYVNEDANGGIYLSKKPMNPTFYMTPAIVKAIPTRAKKITRKGVFAGAIGVTIKNEIIKIIRVAYRDGYERPYITAGQIEPKRIKTPTQ